MPRYRFLGTVTQAGVAFFVDAESLEAARQKVRDRKDEADIDFTHSEIAEFEIAIGTGEAA